MTDRVLDLVWDVLPLVCVLGALITLSAWERSKRRKP